MASKNSASGAGRKISVVENSPAPIEVLLRESAPVLPSALKSRTLASCARARQKRKDRAQKIGIWAVAGVLALQMGFLARIDAQNAALIAGNGPPPVFASVSAQEILASMRERSRQLALLLEPSKLS